MAVNALAKSSDEMGGSLDDLFFTNKEAAEDISLSNQTASTADNPLDILFTDEAAEKKPFSKESRIEFRRQAAEEASLGSNEAVRQAEAARIQAQYRVPEHLWGNVDRVLGIVVNDTELQSIVNRFELTRDKEIDMLQRKQLQDSVSPRLLDAKVSIQNPLDVKATFDLVYDELIGISVIGPLWRDDYIT